MFENLRRTVYKLVNKVSETELNPENLHSILWDFKLSLVENNVAMVVADHICEEMEKRLTGQKINIISDRKKIVKETLKTVLKETLVPSQQVDLLNIVEKKRELKEPCIIVFVGINGTGKTTTIAKIANLLLKNNYSVILAGSDTFRAGSIEQLEVHARRLEIEIIKHQYGADAAAVAFDAVQHARVHGINTVLVDTAGRMQTNRNLLAEMEKIIRVVDPDLVLFVGDSLSGNDVVFQAEEFSKSVQIDGTILTKVDADTKGGAAVSIAYVTKKPILYVGTGQSYDDLETFDPDAIVNRILTAS